ncbi:glycosyl transferase family 2 [Leptolyngbya sp. Heron Island J]|uniref:glycosyltransferase family 2 protein n=1 Tax=Leptolyngbya sp. Heron Island J TaxID=1385935 RepID=UPI0003B9EE7B|nr:glycosyltransferase family 2 protein [Leptolyngbya sp. Heron Island J]ESA37262.1 glycosyl transferase family 2 [Leptolyngbya sp. Heron Island J]
MKLTISIGILAYNEADSINKTLQSLSNQSIFNETNLDWDIEIIIVPNGCTDSTAEVAKKTLNQITSNQIKRKRFSWKVCELAQAGKARAWNSYVHDFSNAAADYLILMDADIQFIEETTLQNLILALETNSNASISTDKPVKDVLLKPNKNLIERLSALASGVSGASVDEVWICGQLYCARTLVLRRITIPLGVEMDDGYLWEMTVTDMLTTSRNLKRVVRAKDASHSFQAYTDLTTLLSHEKWLIVSDTINSFIFDYLKASNRIGEDLSLVIQKNNDSNPDWVANLVRTRVSSMGRWVIPNWFLYRRFKSLKNYSLFKLFWMLPIALMAFLVDMFISTLANSALHRKA